MSERLYIKAFSCFNMACIDVAILSDPFTFYGPTIVLTKFDATECAKSYPVSIASDVARSPVYATISKQRGDSRLYLPPNIYRYSKSSTNRRGFVRKYNFSMDKNAFDSAVNDVLRSAISVFNDVKSNIDNIRSKASRAATAVSASTSVIGCLPQFREFASVLREFYIYSNGLPDVINNNIIADKVVAVINKASETPSEMYDNAEVVSRRPVLKNYYIDYVKKVFLISLRNQVYLALFEDHLKPMYRDVHRYTHDSMKSVKDNLLSDIDNTLSGYNEFYIDQYNEVFSKYLDTKKNQQGVEYVVVRGGDDLVNEFNTIGYVVLQNDTASKELFNRSQSYLMEIVSPQTYLDRIYARARAFRDSYKAFVVSKCSEYATRINESAAEFQRLIDAYSSVVDTYDVDTLRRYVVSSPPTTFVRGRLLGYIRKMREDISSAFNDDIKQIEQQLSKSELQNLSSELNKLSNEVSGNIRRMVYSSQSEADSYVESVTTYINDVVKLYSDKSELFNTLSLIRSNAYEKLADLTGFIDQAIMHVVPVTDISDVVVRRVDTGDPTQGVYVEISVRNVSKVPAKYSLEIQISCDDKSVTHRTAPVDVGAGMSSALSATVDGGFIYSSFGDVSGKSLSVEPKLVVSYGDQEQTSG